MEVRNGQIKEVADAQEMSDAVTYGQSNAIMVDGVMRFTAPPYKRTVSVNSGSHVLYLTTDETSGGAALYTGVTAVHLLPNDANGIYSREYALSGDMKTLTITVKKQLFTGVTVVGIPVLGSVSLGTAPNGTSITVWVEGYR